MEKYLTQTELAKKLGKTTRTISRWQASYGLPVKYVGSTPIYFESEVVEWMRNLPNKPLEEK